MCHCHHLTTCGCTPRFGWFIHGAVHVSALAANPVSANLVLQGTRIFSVEFLCRISGAVRIEVQCSGWIGPNHLACRTFTVAHIMSFTCELGILVVTLIKLFSEFQAPEVMMTASEKRCASHALLLHVASLSNTQSAGQPVARMLQPKQSTR